MPELAELIALMPLAEGLGLVLDEASADRVTGRLAWAERLCTAGGVLHGGTLMAMADTLGALVAFLGLAAGQSTATITSTTQLFRPVTGGVVHGGALPLYRGRTTVTVQTSLTGDGGRLVAQTTQIQAIR
jgi:uncharacterized protein (TIGR00369 family)